MAVISRDLGPITAYAAAVNRGYTGTRAEFEELMASYATVAEQAGESASAAADSASDAELSAGAAVTSASDASSFASAANTSAGNAFNAATAAGIAQTAAESARDAAQSAQTAAEAAQEGAEAAVDGFDSAVTQAISYVNAAGTNQKELAKRQAEKSEAWAVGQISGEDVGVSDPAYHNNAKYYADVAGTSATTATTKASEAAQYATNAAASAQTLVIDRTLTQAGQAADAKVVGDEIEGVKEDLSNYDGITEIAITSQDGKKFINPSGVIVTASGNYHISEPITVNSGDYINVTCTVANGSIVVISLCDENGENIIPVVVGNSSGAESTYSYYVQSDGYIILSYRYDLKHELIKLNDISNTAIKNAVDSNTASLHNQCGINRIKFVYVDGKKYVSSTGNIFTPSGTFHITTPIEVKKGERVEFTATGALTVAMISTCNSDSTSIIPKVLATSTDEQTYVYDVEKDGYIILSYNYSNSAELYILGNIANKRLKDDINNVVLLNSNLLNHRTLVKGKAISAQGVISDHSQYAITQEIPVEAEATYAYRNIIRFVYFNKAGKRIGNTNTSSPEYTGTITTPTNTAYMIAMVMMYNSNIEKVYRTTEWQIVKGSVLPEYQQQQIIVNGYRIADSVPSTHDNVTAFRRWDKICFDKQPVVFAAQESEATTAEDRMTSAIIAKYDALMSANSDYITKTALGTASDGETTIYRYDFSTPGSKVTSGSRPISVHEKTKIILISGVHPEFGGIYGLYNAMREITNNPNLASVKYGVHFIVIPTVNPYGIDTKNRKNANGVDIARNFEIDYVVGTNPSSDTYSGTAALSEPESQIVDAVLSANRDAIIFASCHSFQLSPDNNTIWGSCATMHTTNIVAKLVIKMSRAWRNKYTTIIPQTIDTILGSAGISTEAGSEGKQATKYGVQGLTLETSDYFPYESENPHTSFAMSRNSETYINFITTALGLWEASDPKDLTIIGMR